MGITFHDYDADGTIADEMRDKEAQDRKDEEVRVRFLRGLVGMTERERGRLLALEHDSELQIMWATAMREKLTDVAATIECHANTRGQF